jgi:hypothetical protein
MRKIEPDGMIEQERVFEESTTLTLYGGMLCPGFRPAP